MLNFLRQKTVAVTENDFKKLVSECMDRITMILRTQEGFENLEDGMGTDELLKQQLSSQQVCEN